MSKAIRCFECGKYISIRHIYNNRKYDYEHYWTCPNNACEGHFSEQSNYGTHNCDVKYKAWKLMEPAFKNQSIRRWLGK